MTHSDQHQQKKNEGSRSSPSVQAELPLINLPFMLKQARMDAGKTIAGIADQLRLKPVVVESMENEETYSKENLTTFMRGYIRSYAKLLNIPEERVEAAFNELGIKTKAEIFSPSNFKMEENSPAPLKHKNTKTITYIVISVLVLLVIIWRYSHREVISNTLTINPAQNTISASSAQNQATLPADNSTIPVTATSGQTNDMITPISSGNEKIASDNTPVDALAPAPNKPTSVKKKIKETIETSNNTPVKNEPSSAEKPDAAKHPAVWQDPDFMPDQTNSGVSE